MIDKNKLIKVTNRTIGTVGYSVEDLGIHRTFQEKETKEITFEELEKLSYVPGGERILRNCLVINDEEAIAELLPDITKEDYPEYFYTEKEIDYLLKVGSLEQLLDCLDYAPNGVIEILKNRAVDLPLNDVAKRDIILEKIGFNVTNAISLKQAIGADAAAETPNKRRAAAVDLSGEPDKAPARRVKIIEKK